MAIALSGSLILSGSLTVTEGITMSGSIASASYASNAELLDGLDSTVFTLTSSFNAQTASFTAFSSSINSFTSSATARIVGLEAATASLNSYTSSNTANITSLNSYTSSATARIVGLEAYTSSINAKTSSFATTGSNIFIGTQTITGSLLQSGNYTTTGTIIAQSINVQQVTSSIVYSCGSNNFGTAIGNAQVFTGSMFITGSNIVANIGNACFGGSVCSPSFVGGTVCGTNATFIGQVLVNTDTATNGQLVVSSVGFDDTILRVEQRRSGYASALNLIGVNDAGAAYNYIASGTNSGVVHWRVGGNGTACTLVLSTAGSERLTISSTGVACFACQVCTPSAIITNNLTVGGTSPVYLNFNAQASCRSRVAILYRGTQSGDACMIAEYGVPYLSIGGQENLVNSIQTIGFGFTNGTTYTQPAEIGFQTTSTSGYTCGDLVFATRGATTNTVPTERMRITSAGNVGIGTCTPVGKLDVTLVNTRRFIVTYDDSIVTIKGASDTGAGENLRMIGDNLIFNTNSVGSGTERMRITSTGIACFACQICVPNIISTGVSGGRYATFNAPTNGGYITFEAGGTAFGDLGSYCAQYGTGDATTLSLQSRTGYALALGTNSTEKVRIDTTGNLMVGSLSAGNAGSINVSVGCAGTTAGGLQLWAASNQNHYIQFGDSTVGGAPYSGYVAYAHATDTLSLGTATATRVTISSTGVACFSSTVCANLFAKQFASDGVAICIIGSYTGNPTIFEAGQAGSDGYLKIKDAIGNTTFIQSYTGGSSYFSGKLGIGITSPNETLDVNGTIQVRGNSVGYATTQCVTQLDFYAGAARILSFGGDATTCGGFRFYSAAQNNAGGSDVATISGGGVACFKGTVCAPLIAIGGSGFFQSCNFSLSANTSKTITICGTVNGFIQINLGMYVNGAGTSSRGMWFGGGYIGGTMPYTELVRSLGTYACISPIVSAVAATQIVIANCFGSNAIDVTFAILTGNTNQTPSTIYIV